MASRQHFTITITDVHGSRHYSFGNIFKKYFGVMLLGLAGFVLIASFSIWWLSKEVVDIEQSRQAAESSFLRTLETRQQDYARLMDEYATLSTELERKVQQLTFLDQTLQGLEELMGVEREPEDAIEDRVKLVQLTTLEKQIMLERIPNGLPVGHFQGVSSGFGWRTHPVRGTREFHNGIDYRGKQGDPVIATADGVVEYSGYHQASGYGNLVILSHDFGFKTFYGHLHNLNVKAGEFVKKGDLLGGIGTTGVSTGPHLHYEVIFVQRKLNPAPFVRWAVDDYDSIFDKVEGVPWGSLSQVIRNQVEKVEKQLSLKIAP
ncbi:M23 family metallopeptidase [Thiomicrospira sp. R3]|uniref:M23 family metallopeptidase n=1 Tax=Thiomicrospira sp. R3 TaxID=3035472 RepID=UPI00259BD629|nr:M23 family metallopeptidase [Thiomicrospira sp. R3]WFE68054.1 M23 family metallopeptidase [Thiomicrospira sp. R3]